MAIDGSIAGVFSEPYRVSLKLKSSVCAADYFAALEQG
jgi:hypothetical protein